MLAQETLVLCQSWLHNDHSIDPSLEHYAGADPETKIGVAGAAGDNDEGLDIDSLYSVPGLVLHELAHLVGQLWGEKGLMIHSVV